MGRCRARFGLHCTDPQRADSLRAA